MIMTPCTCLLSRGNRLLYSFCGYDEKILSITNVNALRLEILKLLKVMMIRCITQILPEYKLKDLGNIMPAHTNYPGTYQKLQTHQPSLFLADIVDGRLHFTLKAVTIFGYPQMPSYILSGMRFPNILLRWALHLIHL